MFYPITKKIISHNNPCSPLSAKGAVIHETADPNASAQKEYEYFNSDDRGASAHAFIDDTQILQCIEWNSVAWHACPTANRQFWGVEMCHTDDPKKFAEMWKRAAWLFAHLYVDVAYPRICKVSRTNLMSHAEVSAEWKETDHVDPITYFAKFGKTVDMFRVDVQIQIDNMLFDKALTYRRLISSPNYWINTCKVGGIVNGAYMRQVILNFVAMFKHVDTFDQAVLYLCQSGIVSSPDYWIQHAGDGGTVNGDFARKVLVGMGSKL